MHDQDFPALFRSADALSAKSQRNFLRALSFHLITLVIAAGLSAIPVQHWASAAAQLVALLSALACSIFLFSVRPDKSWYAARAVAESIKTITWRFVCRAEPFQVDDETATASFKNALKQIVTQNTEVCKAFTHELGGDQITKQMLDMRSRSLEDRKSRYASGRIADQLSWYAKKADFNSRRANLFFWILIAVNIAAVIFGILKIGNPEVTIWPTDVLVAIAASILSWMQAKRFSELAASYALTAHEISFIKADAMKWLTNESFSTFVGDAENAFSREHTQWVARKDV
jgi:hypothetical protein